MTIISEEQLLINKQIKDIVQKLDKQNRISNFQLYPSNTLHRVKKKTLIITIGPPARGKSFFGNYIKDNAPYKTKIFNAGSKRREKGYAAVNSNFFETIEGKELLNEWAMETLEEACEWLQIANNNCAIFDATNSTLERRKEIYEKTLKYASKISVIYVEMLCPNPILVHYNMLMKVLTSPDYKQNIVNKIMDDIPLENAISNALIDIKKRDINYLKRYKILTQNEKKKYNFIQFIIPSCTVPPSNGIITMNISKTNWIIKKIIELPLAIVEKTLSGYTSYDK